MQGSSLVVLMEEEMEQQKCLYSRKIENSLALIIEKYERWGHKNSESILLVGKERTSIHPVKLITTHVDFQRVLFLSLGGLITTTFFLGQPVSAQEYPQLPLTADAARLISEGKIRLEDGRVDSLLYRGKILSPDSDDDGDGLINAEEIHTYLKDGKQYYAYNSHPLLYDTDGDGLSDKDDDQPLVWNVTARDMTMFMELVYREDAYINKVLDERSELTELYDNRLEYSMMHNELSHFWKVREIYHLEEGFDAVLFETSSPYPYLEDGAVQVLGIRGTKGARDVDDDLSIFVGANPGQAGVLERLLQRYDGDPSIHNLYATGHSLGGYLAQRGLIEASKRGYTWYKKAYTFNAPKIKGNLFNSWLNSLAEEGNELMKQGKATHYIVDNDRTIRMVGTFEGAISVGSSSNGHGSRTYFEELINHLPEFSVGRRTRMHEVGYKEAVLTDLHFNERVTDGQVYADFIVTSEEIIAGTTVDFTDNISGVPDDASIEDITDYTTIDLTKPGNYIGKIRLMFSDQSTRDVDIPLVVSAPPLMEAEQYTPKIPSDKMEVTDPTTISPEEEATLIESMTEINKGYLPDSVRYQIRPKEGLVVIYADQSEDSIPLEQLLMQKKEVSASLGDTVKTALLIEEIPTIPPENIVAKEVYQGDFITLEETIQNLPEDSMVEIVEAVSSELVGNFKARLKVTFKNKTSRILTIPVTVKARSEKGQGDEETSNLAPSVEPTIDMLDSSTAHNEVEGDNQDMDAIKVSAKEATPTPTDELENPADKGTNQTEVSPVPSPTTLDKVTERDVKDIDLDVRGVTKTQPVGASLPRKETLGNSAGSEQIKAPEKDLTPISADELTNPIDEESNRTEVRSPAAFPVVYHVIEIGTEKQVSNDSKNTLLFPDYPQDQDQLSERQLPATGESSKKVGLLAGMFVLGIVCLSFRNHYQS